MRPTRIFRTSTFRLALLAVLVFTAAGLSILGFVFWATTALMDHQVNQTIEQELDELEAVHRDSGRAELIAATDARLRGLSGRSHFYRLTDGSARLLAGNLEQAPSGRFDSDGWVDFRIESDRTTRIGALPVRARVRILGDGLMLMVGRDLTERTTFRAIAQDAILTAAVLTLVLGMWGGLALSRNALRRLDIINKTAGTILAGDLAQRVPLAGSDDEYDQLAAKLNEMLDRIQKLISAMREVTDNVAHDLRSPLNRLRSRLEVTLMARDAGTDDYRRCLEAAIADVDQILNTFNALLSIARIESGSTGAPFATLALDVLAEDLVDLYQPVAEERHLSLTCRLEPEARIRGDRHLISQALGNLIDNAIKYAGEGGKLRVMVARLPEGVLVEVADDGPGIPADSRKAVLGRFVRLESSRHAPGTGLGLSLVAAVAELHRAKLSLEDNEPGLRVRLVFPPEPRDGTPPQPRAKARTTAEAAE